MPGEQASISTEGANGKLPLVAHIITVLPWVRINRQDISVLALHKPKKGHEFDSHRQMYLALRKLQPDIIHTRNLGTLEYMLVAAVSCSGARIHGEHGRDVYDPAGYIAVSSDLADWLIKTVGVRRDRVSRICNGVDVRCFHPRTDPIPGAILDLQVLRALITL